MTTAYRGMRFLHARVLDATKLPGRVPQIYEVTRVIRDMIYYAAVYPSEKSGTHDTLGSARECCDARRFHTVCKEVIE